MKRLGYFALLATFGLTMAASAQAADAIVPPPQPRVGVTVEVIPGDAPQCRAKDIEVKDSASEKVKKVRDYKDCFKTHTGNPKPRQ